MTFLRRHLAWLISGWLALQVAGLAAAPVALWRVAGAHGDQACDCPIDAGATCPMHHQSRDQDGTCKLRNAFGTSDHALLELGSVPGVLPGLTASVTAFDPGAPVRALSTFAVFRPSVPDAPPPRS